MARHRVASGGRGGIAKSDATAECLRIVSGLLYPVIPGKMGELRRGLGLPEQEIAPHLAGLREWGRLEPGRAIGEVAALFLRIETRPQGAHAGAATRGAGETQAEGSKMSDSTDRPGEPAGATGRPNEPATAGDGQPASGAPDGVALIDIETFSKTRLRVAKVLRAERVPKADRLLRLDITLGDEERQIVAGIAEHYTPEQMIGRLIVVVANLEPARIRGLESRGMLLAAKAGGMVRLVGVDGDVPPGADIG